MSKSAVWFQINPTSEKGKEIKVASVSAGKKAMKNYLISQGYKSISNREFIDPDTKVVRVFCR